MTITKLSIPMLPCTGSITIAGILTLHGRYKSTFLRGHRPTLLATTTKIRSRTHGELHQIIYNQASLPESDKRGKISIRNKPGKVIIGVVVGLCVIGVMSRRYEAQIMSPVPNFGFMSQVFENLMGPKQDKSLADSLEKLDMLMTMAIKLSKDSSDIKLEEVKAASGKPYLHGLEDVDQFIEEGKYEEAEKKCESAEEFKPSVMDNSIALRKFIALVGQAKTHLEQYIKETKSLQYLQKQRKQKDHLIPPLTRIESIDQREQRDKLIQELHRIVNDEFKGEDLRLRNSKKEGNNPFSKFIDTMKRAEEEFENFEEIEKMRSREPQNKDEQVTSNAQQAHHN